MNQNQWSLEVLTHSHMAEGQNLMFFFGMITWIVPDIKKQENH